MGFLLHHPRAHRYGYMGLMVLPQTSGDTTMNVFYGRTFVGYLDNSTWSEENGHVPYRDIGYEHVTAWESYRNGTTTFYTGRSDEGTLV